MNNYYTKIIEEAKDGVEKISQLIEDGNCKLDKTGLARIRDQQQSEIARIEVRRGGYEWVMIVMEKPDETNEGELSQFVVRF